MNELKRRNGAFAMKSTNPAQQFFSIRELTIMFSVSRQTILRWIAKGELSFVRVGLGHVRIPREAIDDLIRRNQQSIRESA